MPAFEVYDTVVARNDPTLVGTVERTHALPENNDVPLDDILIINHADVCETVLMEFINTGVPPKGHVFVICMDDQKGGFLAAEDDLHLLCRSLDLGDTVSKDAILGTIIDISDVYTLQPVWHQGRDGIIFRNADVKADHLRDCTTALTDCPHSILSNIPSHELMHSQSVFEDDLVCYKDWFGQIQERDIDVVLQLETGEIVLLSNPNDLHMPVADTGKPLVSLPEFDDISRPDLLSAFQGYSTVVPTEHPQPGTFCVTSKTTLKEGRWVDGRYKPSLKPQGIVIDVIPRRLHVQWITRNPFAHTSGRNTRTPSEEVTPFTNIETYQSAKDLKKRQDLTIIDFQSQADSPTSSTSVQQDTVADLSCNDFRPSSYLDLRVGDHVRFRDPAGAAVKYYEHPSGTFKRIAPNQSSGWDLNTFQVIAKQQCVKARWQDGAVTSTLSNELKRFMGFETDMAPTEIVINRTGLRQRKSGSSHRTEQPTSFNEMTSFEDMHDFFPSKIGIVQTVDAEERVAKVRWFRDPQVTLLEGGTRTSPDSKFGAIGDEIDELSLYELIKFPALDRRLRDTVVIPPRGLSKEIVDEINNLRGRRTSHLSAMEDLVVAVRESARKRNLLRAAVNHETASGTNATDWIGEIVVLGLDGSVTVRLGTARPCRDVVVRHEEILAVLRFDELGMDDNFEDILDEFLDIDSEPDSDSASASASAISEHYENEAGDRIEDDNDDENWISAEEDDEVLASSSHGEGTTDVHMQDLNHDQVQQASSPDQSTSELSSLLSHLPDSEPSSFAVLDIEPPSDQYGLASAHTIGSTSFLKRIQQEHKTLMSSLPRGQIYVRTYESNLSLLRCLFIGPPDTPYEYAPFLIDLHLGDKYPDQPPTAHFHSWTSGLGRINPNLYEEGKICLSLLGTWAGEQNETWSKNATLLQLLVSLQGLVMVRRPFFNEAGFENYDKEGGYENESAQYSERAFVMAKGFVKHALQRPPVGVEDILAWIYLPQSQGGCLLRKVIRRSLRLIERSEDIRSTSKESGDATALLLDGEGNAGNATTAFLRPLSRGAIVMLKRMIQDLETDSSR